LPAKLTAIFFNSFLYFCHGHPYQDVHTHFRDY